MKISIIRPGRIWTTNQIPFGMQKDEEQVHRNSQGEAKKGSKYSWPPRAGLTIQISIPTQGHNKIVGKLGTTVPHPSWEIWNSMKQSKNVAKHARQQWCHHTTWKYPWSFPQSIQYEYLKLHANVLPKVKLSNECNSKQHTPFDVNHQAIAMEEQSRNSKYLGKFGSFCWLCMTYPTSLDLSLSIVVFLFQTSMLLEYSQWIPIAHHS